MLVWLSVCSNVQTCIWPTRCHCLSLSLASLKSRLVLPFWYRLTWVVLEKGPLNGCVCSSSNEVLRMVLWWQVCTVCRMVPTCPDVGLVSATMAFSVVDLPAPFGPSRPKISPASTAKLLLTTATFVSAAASPASPPRFSPRHCGRPRRYSLCRFLTTSSADYNTDMHTQRS